MPTHFMSVSLTRLAGAAIVVAGLVAGTVADVAAQQAPAQQAAPAVTFAGDGGVVFWQVKPDRTADFEAVMAKWREALGKTEDPVRKQIGAGLRIYKTTPWVAPGGNAPDPAANVLYLLIADPAAKDADYSSAAILKLLYEAFPSEGQDLYKKLVESSAGGRSVLNLQQVAK
jgi:hypothetical protein